MKLLSSWRTSQNISRWRKSAFVKSALAGKCLDLEKYYERVEFHNTGHANIRKKVSMWRRSDSFLSSKTCLAENWKHLFCHNNRFALIQDELIFHFVWRDGSCIHTKKVVSNFFDDQCYDFHLLDREGSKN